MSPNPLRQICLSFFKAFSSLLVKLFAFHSLPNHNGLCCTFPSLDWSGKNFNCTLSNSYLNISHFSLSRFPTVSRNPITSTFHSFQSATSFLLCFLLIICAHPWDFLPILHILRVCYIYSGFMCVSKCMRARIQLYLAFSFFLSSPWLPNCLCPTAVFWGGVVCGFGVLS